jgi:threonine/homoserine/homoserine lactone efflux protein
MGDAMAGMLPSAVGVAISPLPIVAVLVILVTAHGRVNGAAFIVGWVIGLVTIGVVFLTIASDVDPVARGESATWVSGVGVLLGILLLSIALRQWRQRPRGGDEVNMPRWIVVLDQVSPRQAAGAGVALAALNPKNLLLGVVGAAAIARSGGSSGQQAVAYAVFVLIATIGVGAPVLIFLAMGERSRTLLDALRKWMARNNAVLVALLLVIVGVKLIGDGISQLRSRSLLRCPYMSSRTTAQSAVTLLSVRPDVF